MLREDSIILDGNLAFVEEEWLGPLRRLAPQLARFSPSRVMLSSSQEEIKRTNVPDCIPLTPDPLEGLIPMSELF